LVFTRRSHSVKANHANLSLAMGASQSKLGPEQPDVVGVQKCIATWVQVRMTTNMESLVS
jgi:hypothetical protein